jgi:hypothetical protein
MKVLGNIWDHPRTSAAGLLIGIVTIAGALSQQGITLGSAGTGTVVSLIGAIAAALLGLLAKDPGDSMGKQSSGSTGGQAKLGVWALIALLMPLPFLGGCSGMAVAQNIVDWTPALESAVASMDSAGAVLSPGDGRVYAAATAGFNATAELLIAQAKAYLANPSAGMLAQMQVQVVVLQQQVNTAMLQAARIVNPASQQHALAAIQAVGTIVTVMLALVQSVSSKSAVAQMAAASKVKMSAVLPLVNQRRAAELVAAHYGEPVVLAQMQVAQVEWVEMSAGF